MADSNLLAEVQNLLAQKKVVQPAELVGVDSHGNNQVFLVRAGGSRFLLKVYFSHELDRRDRFGTETEFHSLLWGNGIRSIPELFASNPTARMALFEFIDGRKPTTGEIDDHRMEEFEEFFRLINTDRPGSGKRFSRSASEACFRIDDHLALVETRIKRLAQIQAEDDLSVAGQTFVREKLIPLFFALQESSKRLCRELNLEMGRELTFAERCLSPSDFGFHNALIGPNGALKFIDFEYAGWDDPAKMAADFFCQPNVSVPDKYIERFLDMVSQLVALPEIFRRRFRVIFPLYQLKWCCIILNEFLPVGMSRRSFANAASGSDVRRKRQLSIAKKIVGQIKL